MKPSPMPLFNYKRRERHALVSDPQKSSKPNSLPDSTPPTAPSDRIPTASSFSRPDVHKSMPLPWTDTRNCANTPSPLSSYNSNNKSQSFSKSAVAIPSKPTLVFPKAPALLSHKPGVNNRRGTAAVPNPLDNGKKYGQSSLNHNLSAKEAKPSTPTRGLGSLRGRCWGSNSMYNNDGIFLGAGESDNLNHPRNFGQVRNNDSNNYFSSNDNVSAFSPSAIVTGFSPSSSRNSWSNTTSEPQNKRNIKGRNVDTHTNKPNIVKVQSGSNHSQYGTMRNKNSQQNAADVQSHPDSMGDSNTSNTFSIFDEEDVTMQPSLKYSKVSPTPIDNSLRVFTCPIKDMQSWSETGGYDGPVLFEIYGLLISGPANTHLHVGKEMYIRDQSATIRCVFYEIDRDLPQLSKGQVHRVVGSMDKSRGGGGSQFKVVSIRKADKEERWSCKQATEVSLNEMDILARLLGKEQ